MLSGCSVLYWIKNNKSKENILLPYFDTGESYLHYEKRTFALRMRTNRSKSSQ